MEIIYVELPVEFVEVWYDGKVFRNTLHFKDEENENLHISSKVQGRY